MLTKDRYKHVHNSIHFIAQRKAHKTHKPRGCVTSTFWSARCLWKQEKRIPKRNGATKKRWVTVCKCRRRIFLMRRQSWNSTTQCRRRVTCVWEADGPLMMYQWSPANCDVNSRQQNEWNYGKTERTSVCLTHLPWTMVGLLRSITRKLGGSLLKNSWLYSKVDPLRKSRVLSPLSATHLQNIFVFKILVKLRMTA